jgi:exonuclease V gamma subunit
VYYREEDEGVEILEPLSVGKPETRAIYRALFELLPKGELKQDVLQTLLEAAGELPVGVTGTFGFMRVLEQARPFIDAYNAILAVPSLPAVSTVRTLGTWQLEIDHPRITRDGIQSVKPGKVYDHDIIAFWIRMVAVSAVHPSAGRVPLNGTLLGVNALVKFAPVKEADLLLQRLLHWYGVGLQRPLHFFSGYALEFARGTEKGEPEAVLSKFRHRWDHPSDFGGFTDDQDPYVASAFPSGEAAINEEFAVLAREIAVRLSDGMERTDLIKKGK